MQENARITAKLTHALHSQKPSNLWGTGSKKEKLQVTLDIDGKRSPPSVVWSVRNLPNKVDLKRSKPVGVAKMKQAESMQTKID